MSLTETKDMRLPKKLKTLRKKSGLTQGELAEKLRTSRQTVSYWETGAVVPTTDNLRFLSRLYGVSLDDLLDDGRELSQREAEQPKAPGPEEQAQPPDDSKKKKRDKLTAVLAVIVAAIIALIACALIFSGILEDGKKSHNLQTSEVNKDYVGDMSIETFQFNP